jgi:zinc and cadmium transporter
VTASGLSVLLYSFLMVVATWAGGLLPLARTWSRGHLRLFIAFSGGVLLGAAFLHMLPEAARVVPEWVGPAALAGLVLVFLLERFVLEHFCEHHADHIHDLQRAGYSLYIGLTIHTFIDGLVLGSSLLIPYLGPIVLIALLSHKIPAAFSLTSVLLAAEFRRRRILVLLALFSLTVPVGAAVAFWGLRGLGPQAWETAVALSAGTFLYIALTDLLPEVRKESEGWDLNVLALLLGLGVMYVSGLLAHHTL